MGAFIFLVEMARTEASLRSLLRNLSHLYVPFADAKDGLCSFDYLDKNKNPEKLEFLFYGGDGGNRNHVRKSIPETFYECSLSIIIPYATADKQAFVSVAL